MPGQHARGPVPYRPPADMRDWLPEEAERHGIAVNLVITEALGHAATGVIPPRRRNYPRKPARPARRAAPVAAELARERARDQRDDDAPVCLHRVPPGAYCTRCGRLIPERRTAPKGER